MATSSDLFSHDVSFGGAFSADGATISFDQPYTGLLVQNMQWQYQQNITRLFDVTSTDIYLVSGRTQGQGSMQRVMGPSALSAGFFTTYGNVCYSDQNTLTISVEASCDGTGANVVVAMNNLVLNSYGGSVNAQDMVVNEGIGFVFMYLTYSVS